MAEHISAPRTYLAVFAALLVLTAATVGASFLPLGHIGHAMAGLGIAALKATLVLLFFMHLLYSPRITWLFVLAALLWLGIMMTFTVNDYISRNWWPG